MGTFYRYCNNFFVRRDLKSSGKTFDILDKKFNLQKMSEGEGPISEYRKGLVQAEQEMQMAYDKAVMTLSGGALGVSFTFLKEVVSKAALTHPRFLLAAWVCWGFSITCTLMSFYTSTLALRRAIKQTDEQRLYRELIGGNMSKLTAFLNFAGGVLFLLGVLFLVVFVGFNLQ